VLEQASSTAARLQQTSACSSAPPRLLASALGFQRSAAVGSPLSPSPIGIEAIGSLPEETMACWSVATALHRTGTRLPCGRLPPGRTARRPAWPSVPRLGGGTEPSVEPRTSEALLFPGSPWRTSSAKQAVSARTPAASLPLRTHCLFPLGLTASASAAPGLACLLASQAHRQVLLCSLEAEACWQGKECSEEGGKA